jgi:predicted nucleic acid-binding protein
LILVDTSVWIDHLRRGDKGLTALLVDGRVLGHPAVVGEIGLGSLANRQEVLGLMSNLPQAVQATHAEVMSYVEAHALHEQGIGYVDAHLLASAALTPGSSLWTRDKRLRTAAATLGTLAARAAGDRYS